MEKVTYAPRNEMVLIRILDVGMIRGVALPQISVQGKRYLVEAVGHKVENLDVGDEVLMIGKEGAEYYPLSNHSDLLVIHQIHCVLKITREEKW